VKVWIRLELRSDLSELGSGLVIGRKLRLVRLVVAFRSAI